VRRLHAEVQRDLLRRTEDATTPPDRWCGISASQLGDLRSALDWAFSPGGDPSLGVELTAGAMDFWLAASLLTECCEWGGKALARIGAAAATRLEMILQSGLGMALALTKGANNDANAALMKALAIAQALGDLEYQRRAACCLWQFWGRALDFRTSLAFARRYEELVRAAGDPAATATADWMIGLAQTALAEHVDASERPRRAIECYPGAMRSRELVHLGADLRASALCHLAANLWLRGLLDAAIRTCHRAIEHARDIDHPVSLCLALVWSAGILFLNLGMIDAAARYISELIAYAEKYALVPFRAVGLCAQGRLVAMQGDSGLGVRLLRSGIEGMQETGYQLFAPLFLTELADVLGSIGCVDDGIGEVDRALQRAAATDYLWFMPEILRVKGRLLATSGDHGAAEDLLLRSLGQARRQQALYWELRSAISTARLWRERGRHSDAHSLLRPVYASFTEGFATADLRTAEMLLEQLRHGN